MARRYVRMAPIEYIGRFMQKWWDYAIADELHQLANLTAQGNALGVLARTGKATFGIDRDVAIGLRRRSL